MGVEVGGIKSVLKKTLFFLEAEVSVGGEQRSHKWVECPLAHDGALQRGAGDGWKHTAVTEINI